MAGARPKHSFVPGEAGLQRQLVPVGVGLHLAVLQLTCLSVHAKSHQFVGHKVQSVDAIVILVHVDQVVIACSVDHSCRHRDMHGGEV